MSPHSRPASPVCRSLALLLAGPFASFVQAQVPSVADARAEQPEALAPVLVEGARVAVEAPPATFAMPVSLLTFEPRVDVQARNFAEGQADIAIRGGTFENTSFRLGAVTIYDPQTGHYTAEIPVAPTMLLAPTVSTGVAQGFGGTQSSVGALRYGFRPITRTGGTALAAVGDFATRRGELYQSYARLPVEGASGVTWAADAAAGWSRSDGSLAGGDHDFSRVSVRLQRRTATAQTDVLYGYQHKFFGWPNLYTPFGFQETENLQTNLALVSHTQQLARGWITASAYGRRHKDDYEFNRAVPGASNPFQHETWVAGAAVEGRHEMDTTFLGAGAAALGWRAEILADDLKSTALTFGRYSSRSLGKLALLPELTWRDAAGAWTARAGATYDDSSRDASAVSPLAELVRTWDAGPATLRRASFGFSESTQLASYTALNSAPASGLFRGNPDLGRATSREVELTAAGGVGAWSWEAATFFRQDDDLVDWTFRRGVTARTANAVDLETTGVELFVRRSAPHFDVMFGYTALTKTPDFGAATVDASFYALNFPRHRLTLATIWRPLPGLELRVDNELRHQEDNFLRRTDGDAWLTTAALSWRPRGLRGVEIFATADNLWNDDFEEVPAVPAGRRTVVGGVSYAW